MKIAFIVAAALALAACHAEQKAETSSAGQSVARVAVQPDPKPESPEPPADPEESGIGVLPDPVSPPAPPTPYGPTPDDSDIPPVPE